MQPMTFWLILASVLIAAAMSVVKRKSNLPNFSLLHVASSQRTVYNSM